MPTNENVSAHASRDAHFALLDKLTAKVDAMTFEPSALAVELSRHERWIKKIAEKAGVALEF